MIFYFSGTGNSQRTAIQMSELLGDEIVTMNKYLKKSEKRYVSIRRIHWYLWRLPIPGRCQRLWSDGFVRQNSRGIQMLILS